MFVLRIFVLNVHVTRNYKKGEKKRQKYNTRKAPLPGSWDLSVMPFLIFLSVECSISVADLSEYKRLKISDEDNVRQFISYCAADFYSNTLLDVPLKYRCSRSYEFNKLAKLLNVPGSC